MRDAAIRTATALSGLTAVESLWLVGSFATGHADPFSDADFVAVMAPGEAGLQDVRHQVREALTVALEPVLADEHDFGGSVLFNLVTPAWERVDLTIFPSGATLPHRGDAAIAVYDRGASPPRWAASQPVAAASREVSDEVREVIRVLGLAPVVLGRGNVLVAFSGCGLLVSLLTRVAVRIAGTERASGALALPQLPDGLRAPIVGMPPVRPDRAGLLDFHCAAWGVLGELLGQAPAGGLGPELSRAQRALIDLYERELGVSLIPLPDSVFG